MKKRKIILYIIGIMVIIGLAKIPQVLAYQPNVSSCTSKNIYQVIQHKQSGAQVGGSGTVVHILSDDNKGSRHQRFILKIDRGNTLLFAHNIDLAEKLQGLKKGDKVAFCGEYQSNQRGGVVHWTHRAPSTSHHFSGWLKWQGKIYQ